MSIHGRSGKRYCRLMVNLWYWADYLCVGRGKGPSVVGYMKVVALLETSEQVC